MEIAFTKRMSLVCYVKGEDQRETVLSDIMQYRFIQDLLRFHIPEISLDDSSQELYKKGGINSQALSNYMLYLPLRAYIRLRYYRFQIQRRKPGSNSYKKYCEKYDTYLEQYQQYWNM